MHDVGYAQVIPHETPLESYPRRQRFVGSPNFDLRFRVYPLYSRLLLIRWIYWDLSGIGRFYQIFWTSVPHPDLNLNYWLFYACVFRCWQSVHHCRFARLFHPLSQGNFDSFQTFREQISVCASSLQKDKHDSASHSNYWWHLSLGSRRLFEWIFQQRSRRPQTTLRHFAKLHSVDRHSDFDQWSTI